MQSRSIDQTTIGDRSTASRQVRPASLKGRRMPRRRAGRSGAGRSRKPIERPNGYRVENRALHVVEEHAAFVRDLFRGSVATILTKDARRWWAGSSRSCGPVEQVGDKGGLAADIMTVNLSNLCLPHYRHALETRQRLPRRTETAEAEPRPDKALDTPVVLLDDVVQIFTLSQTSAAP